MPANEFPEGDYYCDLGDDITCVDADYVAPGMACFYLLRSADEYALIETGTSRSLHNLDRLLRARGIDHAQIRYVIPTHVHLDHAGGAGAMLQRFTEAHLLIHPRGLRHMVDPTRLVAASRAVYGDELFASLYGDILPVPEARVRALADGESVSFGERRLLFRHTEGHALHHFCVWDEQSRGWFTGDMFGLCYPWCRFPDGDFLLPSTTPTQFDPVAYLASLSLLQAFSPRRMYLTHYGAIRFSAQKLQQLAAQIEAYCELAERHSSDESALQAALADDALNRIAAAGCTRGAASLAQDLEFDMQLNAQGLLAWRQRASR
ncbi:MAG: MBL fold metallo-hydrolase [Halioglobus sp.]